MSEETTNDKQRSKAEKPKHEPEFAPENGCRKWILWCPYRISNIEIDQLDKNTTVNCKHFMYNICLNLLNILHKLYWYFTKWNHFTHTCKPNKLSFYPLPLSLFHPRLLLVQQPNSFPPQWHFSFCYRWKKNKPGDPIKLIDFEVFQLPIEPSDFDF